MPGNERFSSHALPEIRTDRRKFLKWLATGVVALIPGIWESLDVEAKQPSELTPHELLKQLGYRWVWGDTHCHSQCSDGFNLPGLVLMDGTAHQDFIFLTDHAEKLSHAEVQQLLRSTQELQRSGQLAGFGYEWTGTPEYRDVRGQTTYDPRQMAGYGHMLVYGTSSTVGQGFKDDGQPDVIAATFGQFLHAVERLPDAPLVAFAHPSLCRPRTEFDANDDGNGFDPPPDAEILDQVCGCEVCSHTLQLQPLEGYRGLGDAEATRQSDLAQSNEACYRQLLRRGWHVSPMMSTDSHLPFYLPGPYTAVAVRERSIEGVEDGLYERLTCATEQPGVSIALAVWQEKTGSFSVPGHPGEPTRQCGPLAIMGQTLPISDEADSMTASISIRDKQGRPIKAKVLGLVVVGPNLSEDYDTTYPLRSQTYPPLSDLRSYAITPHPRWCLATRAKAMYAKAILPNGRALISAPVFFHYGE